MSARARSIVLVAATLSTAALLAGCTAQADPLPTPAASSPVVAPTPTDGPEPSASATAASDVSCASLLPADTVADFEGVGWSAKEEPLHVGGIQLTDGIQCTWGDYSVATDHVQIFGWAPIDDAQAVTAQDELLANGWRREDSAEGLYITESRDTAIATDENGYGITYLFGDGWVTIADTKQGLVLIERPDA